jgi:hypothetical protein
LDSLISRQLPPSSSLAVRFYFFLVGRRFLLAAEAQSLDQELCKEYLTEVMVTPQSTIIGWRLDQFEWAKRQGMTIVGAAPV